MIWQMTIKDVKRMIRDKKALLITLLMPIVLIAILGFSVGSFMQGESTLSPAQVAVVNEDDINRDLEKLKSVLTASPFARGIGEREMGEILGKLSSFHPAEVLTERVLKDEKIASWISVETMGKEEAFRRLKEGKVTAVILIPEGFAYRYWLSSLLPVISPSTVEVWQDPDQEIRAGIVEGIVRAYTDTLSAGILAKNVFQEAAVEMNRGDKAYSQIETLLTSVGKGEGKEFEVHFRSIAVEGKKSISGFQYYAAAMSAMFILFTASYGAEYFIQESRFHTYERILLSGRGRGVLYAGRFLSTSLFSLLQMILLLLFSRFLFGVNWGDPVALFSLLLLVSLGVGGLSLLLSAINHVAGNEKGSEIFSGFITQIMALAGGSFIPVAYLPDGLRLLGDFTINGAALQGFVKVMQGYSLSEILPVFANLFIMTLLFMAAALAISRLKEV